MAKVIQDKSKAHQILVSEELGINEELKGSAMETLSGIHKFTIGAILPVIPFFFSGVAWNSLVCINKRRLGLFVIGQL